MDGEAIDSRTVIPGFGFPTSWLSWWSTTRMECIKGYSVSSSCTCTSEFIADKHFGFAICSMDDIHEQFVAVRHPNGNDNTHTLLTVKEDMKYQDLMS